MNQFEHFRIPRNHALTILDGLRKFTQAYSVTDKTSKIVVNPALVFYHYKATSLCIHCDYDTEFDKLLVENYFGLFDIKSTFSSAVHHSQTVPSNNFRQLCVELFVQIKQNIPRTPL